MRTPKVIVVLLALLILRTAGVLWWVDRPKKRPNNVSLNALHIEKVHVPFTFSEAGYWIDCWLDERENADRCKLTDLNGKIEFEDVFLPYEGQSPIPQSELIFDVRRVGGSWMWVGSSEISVPVIYLTNHQILLPRAAYQESKHAVDEWIRSGGRP
jgi:hypothetical protein